MKKQLVQRLLSLLLTFALVLSMAGSAFAADGSTESTDEDQLVIADEADTSATDEVSEAEQDDEAEEQEETPSDETETSEDETTTASESSGTQTSAAPQSSGIVALSVPAESAEQSVDAADAEGGWSVELDKATGEYTLSFTYQEDGQAVKAVDGYYSIPEVTNVQVNGTSYTFCAGIYAFDGDGVCQQALDEDNVNVAVTVLTEEDGDYIVSSTASYEVTLGDVSWEGAVVSSATELFTGVEELSGLYHSFTDGVDNGYYSGSFLNTSINEICFATNGVALTETGSYHWYQNKLYYFKSTVDGLAVGTLFTGTHKFVATLPAAQASTYDTGVIYYMIDGVGVNADGSYHWYKNKLYYFSGSSSQKGGISVGSLFTGTHKFVATLPTAQASTYDTGVVYYMKNGVGVNADGSYHWYKGKLYYFSGSSSQKGGISVGSLFTGTHKFVATLPASQAGTYDTGVVYYMKNGVGVADDGSYHWYKGKLYYFSGSSSQKGGISVGTAYSGNHYCATLPSSVTNYTAKRWYVFKNGVGTLLTGYLSSKCAYYKNGVIYTSLTGWKTISGKTYYFKKGRACTGWNYLKRNGKTYKYYFRSDGSLVEDLYSYFGKSYYSKKQRIYVNRYSNNITIYQYNSSTKDYDIPLKTMVCSTSKTMNLKYGTYTISQMARWYHKGKWYWQYLTYIGSTGALFHSCRYYSKNTNTMQVSNYNSMGKSNSDGCIRVALGTARLIYNLVGAQSKGAITCKYYYSKDYGPFGQATVANTTGKLSGTKAKDPTE